MTRPIFSALIDENLNFVIPRQEAIVRWAKSQKPGRYVIEPRRAGLPRNLKQNGLYFLRNEILSQQNEIDMDKMSLHDFLMIECGYAKEKTFRGRTFYDRESSTKLTVSEFSKLFTAQDELCRFVNEGRAPEHYLILPSTEMGKPI